jgi:hypothetical protein
MSLRKSKCWYSSNCSHFLKCAIQLPKLLFEREKENHPFMGKEGEGGGKREEGETRRGRRKGI